MGNNPILHNDENGDIFGVDNLIGAAIGAAIEAGTQMAVNAATGKDVFDLDYADIAVEAAVGFATSGIGNIAKAGKTTQRLVKAANTASKAINSNKTLRTVAKVSKATGAGKNAIKASIDVKHNKKDGLHSESIKNGQKKGEDAVVDFIGGIAGDGLGNLVNDAVTEKVTKQITRATNKSHKAVNKEIANKYAKKATGAKAKAAAIKAPGSLNVNFQAGVVGDAKKKQNANNDHKKH